MDKYILLGVAPKDFDRVLDEIRETLTGFKGDIVIAASGDEDFLLASMGWYNYPAPD